MLPKIFVRKCNNFFPFEQTILKILIKHKQFDAKLKLNNILRDSDPYKLRPPIPIQVSHVSGISLILSILCSQIVDGIHKKLLFRNSLLIFQS